jgi:hypothetical protein
VLCFESPPGSGPPAAELVAPFVWTAVISVGTILAVIAVILLMLQ